MMKIRGRADVRFIIILAFKNLARYKRRTLITASAIAFGLMLFFIFDSIIIGVQSDSERNLREFETAELRIMHTGYWQDRLTKPLDLSVSDPDVLLSDLRDEGFRATKRISFLAEMLLSSTDFGEDGNMSVEVTAVDLEHDSDVFNFNRTLSEGRFPAAGADEVVIGSWFAEDIGAKVGSWITLVTRGNGGFYEVMDLEIVGIVNCPNPNVNRVLLMIPFETADEYLAMDGAATEIDIAVPDLKSLEKAEQRVAGIASGYDVMNWKELASDYFAFAAADEGSADVMLFFVFLITAVGISNTMLMSVQERIRELGMMRAIGMSDASITLAFFAEAGGIGLLGALAGLALGSFLNIFLVIYGIDFSFMMRDMDMGYRVSGVMRGVWSLTSMAVTLATGIFLPMLFSLIPTRRALKRTIPECLHHQ